MNYSSDKLVRKSLLLVFILLGLTVSWSRAANTQAELLLGADSVRAGDTILVAVRLKMAPEWHTYWKNPGAAGQATEIKWSLPVGVTAGEIRWPVPEKIPPIEITTYGYKDEVLLLVPLSFAKDLAAGALTLNANVAWLECKESCIPANADVSATITIGSATTPSANATKISAWEKRVPQTSTQPAFQIYWQQPARGEVRELSFQIIPATGQTPGRADFFPFANDDFEVGAEITPLQLSAGAIGFSKPVKKIAGEWPTEISGVLLLDEKAWEIKSPISLAPAAGRVGPALWLMLLYAFIGGLILNVMPCVLPVIALKILGFVNDAHRNPMHIRKLGSIYTLGVLASFLALAALVIGVKAAGEQAAWGMQFDSPIFLVGLITLVTLVAINLFGVFEVTLGGSALDAASKLANRSGSGGAFFNGVLATVLATPCTAPVLGTALGFAFTQPASVLTLIFLSVGSGLATPYLILSWNPAWLRFLPKPGVWMEKFKIAMGFPMLATVIWLLNVAAGSYGKSVVWVGIFLVCVALGAWIFGEFFQRGQQRRTLALCMSLAVVAFGYLFALERQLDWRRPPVVTDHGVADGFWEPWSPAAVTAARAAGRPVLVDFTADWCLTCRVNAQTSLEIDSVRAKLKAINAVALKGDYTHFPKEITAELTRYNRAGLPLVLVYPKDANAPPFVLPEILTPGIVLEKLEAAAR